MTTIRAVVRDRRIDVAVPSDWADGTEVLLTLGSNTPDDDGPMSPEEIAAVLEAMQKIEPFDWSAEERAAWEAEQLVRKEWEKAQFAANADQARRLWE